MLYLTSEDELVLQPKLQALYFYASWMPYHKKMQTMINKMEEKYPTIDFFAVDIDYFKTFIKRFKIDSIPSILILNNGKEIKRINGLILTSALKSAFADICKV
jgi:thioredoxin-like negative regulator of GroEL